MHCVISLVGSNPTLGTIKDTNSNFNGFDSLRILADFIKWLIKLYPVFSCSLVVRIARFHRAGPGSIPGRRILKEQTANIII